MTHGPDRSRPSRPSWAFLGQNAMGAAALEALCTLGTPPDLVITRAPRPDHQNDVEAVALGHRLDLVHARGHDLTSAILARVRGVDSGVCCGWARQLDDEALSAPTSGWLNLHPGELPTWAGSDPIGWQSANGQSHLTCTAHLMVRRVDGGPVVATESLALLDHDGLTLRRRAGAVLGQLAHAWLVGDAAVAANAPGSAVARACPPRGVQPLCSPEIMSARTLARVVRSFSPFPGVMVWTSDEELRLVVALSDDAGASLSLTCRDGELLVAEMPGGAYLRRPDDRRPTG